MIFCGPRAPPASFIGFIILLKLNEPMNNAPAYEARNIQYRYPVVKSYITLYIHIGLHGEFDIISETVRFSVYDQFSLLRIDI